MVIRVKKGVSGYRNGIGFRYSVGSIESVDDFIGHDLIKADIAEPYEDFTQRPIAVAPMISSVKAVVKRKRHV